MHTPASRQLDSSHDVKAAVSSTGYVGDGVRVESSTGEAGCSRLPGGEAFTLTKTAACGPSEQLLDAVTSLRLAAHLVRPAPSVNPLRVGVVSCCGPKLEGHALARDLYRSPLFKLSRRFVELTCDTWVILSALYRVVLPTQPIAPYDQTLGALSDTDYSTWGKLVRHELELRFPGAHFVVLAGARYQAPLEGLSLEAPLAGKQIGRRLSWLKARVAERGRARA